MRAVTPPAYNSQPTVIAHVHRACTVLRGLDEKHAPHETFFRFFFFCDAGHVEIWCCFLLDVLPIYIPHSQLLLRMCTGLAQYYAGTMRNMPLTRPFFD